MTLPTNQPQAGQEPNTDKHIMITGGSSGIGLATARTCARRGARVTLLDLQPPPADSVLHHQMCDVSNPEHWQSLTGPAPDHLFLNAGVMSAAADADASQFAFNYTDAESYRRVRGINLDGVVFGLQTMLPRMQPGGSVVVTASLAGLYPFPFDPIYAATKHALVGLVTSLAPNLVEQDIRLHVLCPDRVDTNLLPDATRAGGCLAPELIADAVCQLFNEPGTGYVWQMSIENPELQRVYASPRSLAARLRARLRRWGPLGR